MKVARVVLLILILSLSSMSALAKEGDILLQSYVGGYHGCYLVEVLGEPLVGPYWGEGYVSYWAPANYSVPMRFWSYDSVYGYGMIYVRYPQNSNQGALFTPLAVDGATTWTQPMLIGQSTILLDPSQMYFPPASQMPANVQATYPTACSIPAPTPVIGTSDAPGCVVDDIFIGVSTSPRIACNPEEGFTIDHFELVLDGVVVEGNLPDNQFKVHEMWGTTCARFSFSGFWPDSSVGVIVVGSDGLRYPYRVTVRGSQWRSNDYRTVVCSLSDDVRYIRPVYGDSVDIYLLALGLPVTKEMKQAWFDSNQGLVVGVWYPLPQAWLAGFGQGVGEN